MVACAAGPQQALEVSRATAVPPNERRRGSAGLRWRGVGPHWETQSPDDRYDADRRTTRQIEGLWTHRRSGGSGEGMEKLDPMKGISSRRRGRGKRRTHARISGRAYVERDHDETDCWAGWWAMSQDSGGSSGGQTTSSLECGLNSQIRSSRPRGSIHL